MLGASSSGAAPGATGCVAPRYDLTRLVLEEGGVHEIKPAAPVQRAGASPGPEEGMDWPAAWAAAHSFALAMIARRAPTLRRPVLWCMPRRAVAEHGMLYSHGLRRFGLMPGAVLMVETGNEQDTLWALEEGLRSGCVSLVAGFIDDVALTPARRLALAAQKHLTPCLLLTHPRGSPAAATATRWRVAPAPGAPHPLLTATAGRAQPAYGHAPGARRLAMVLERCRGAPEALSGQEQIMEWSDEAVCLHLVASVSDRSHASGMPATGS